MRREWALVALVLVPFAALVGFGLWLTPPQQGGFGSLVRLQIPPEKKISLPLAAEPAVDGGGDAGAAEAVPDSLKAPIRAVEAPVHACFVDNGSHLHGRIDVVVAFTPTRDGRFSDVRVESQLGASPYVGPCIEDVFSEVQFAPTGRETFTPVTHTFVFDAAAR